MAAQSNLNAGQLDSNQILQRGFDEVLDRHRVDATVTVVNEIEGEVAVEIDAADGDNIAIANADGSKKATISTVGSKEALDVSLSTVISTPSIQNVSMATAGTEYSAVISATSKEVTLKGRLSSKIQIAFTSGQSGTNYITIPMGCEYSLRDLQLSGALTVYAQSSVNSEVLEILSWN